MAERQLSALLRSEQAAEYLNLAVSTLAKMRHYGTGPVYVKIGGRVLYPKHELETFVSAHRRLSTSDEANPKGR